MPLSTFLNGRSPARLRGLLWLALSDTGQVLTQTSTSDSGGGATQSWVAGGTIACRIDALNTFPISRVTGGALDERSTHMVTVPPDTDVSLADRFVIAGRGTFEVTAIRRTTAESATHFEVKEIS